MQKIELFGFGHAKCLTKQSFGSNEWVGSFHFTTNFGGPKHANAENSK